MGIKIREARKAVGMSQKELAIRAGLSRQTLSAIENNEQKKPTVRTLEKIAEALGVTIDRIFFADDA